MAYTFVIDIAYLNLNSIFHILNAKSTKDRFLAYENTMLEIDPRDFLTIFLRL